MTVFRQNAERLLNKLENSTRWPPTWEQKLLEDIYLWMWFREAESLKLKAVHEGWDEDKKYVVDPLASRIAEAFGDLIFGEEPDFSAATKADQPRLEDLIRENNLPSELQQGCEVSTSEGETWWRCRVEKDASDWPIVEFHSRSNVIPLFRGRHVIAVAFINVIEENDEAWRYLEIHAEGIVLNRLFKVPIQRTTSRDSSILPVNWFVGKPFGDEVPLTDRPETADLDPEWVHDLPMLAGRIMNRRGRKMYVGVSQFARARDLLFELNEAASIGSQNMRLTARKRAVVDESVLQPQRDPETGEIINPRPVFRADEEIFVQSALDENLESKTGQFKVLEYDFDAQGMVTWDDHLVLKILTRTRCAPQLVGMGVEQAITGPALRARLLDSTLAANGKARFWDDGVPRMLQCLQLIDQLPLDLGGFGRTWESSDEKPSMKRKSIIPEDPKDVADRHAVLMGSELESQYTAIAEMHPEWDDEKIKAEQARIREDARTFVQPGTPNGLLNRNNVPPPAPVPTPAEAS